MSAKRKYSSSSSSDDEKDVLKPGEKDKKNAILSPHTWQNPNSTYSSNFKRVLTEDYPRLKYRRRKGETKTTVHYGQRKLLLSEIEFLSIVFQELSADNKKIVLIYAGAAAGHHLPTLINAFPFIEYILVDPGKFHIDSTSYKSKVEIRQEYFTDEMAHTLKEKYSDYIRLFVSDIRTANYRQLTRDATEFKVEDDMVSQMRWYRILKPFKSILKFRLPYVGNYKTAKTELEYLDGKIYFQVWPGCTSSETRLMVEPDAKMKLYDCVKYEDQLFRFNTIERTLCYEHDIIAPGIDHCYDCRAEVHILEEYLKVHDKLLQYTTEKFPIPKPTVTEFIDLINKNLKAASRYILIINERMNYGVKFTDFRYGATKQDIFTKNALEKGKTVGYDFRSDTDEEVTKVQIKTKPSVHERLNFDKN